MTIDQLLDQLQSVKPTTRGWMARCPAHQPDKTPSLSVKEGDRGILLKCWAGCRLVDIVSALHLRLTDLFFNHEPDLRIRAAQQRQRAATRSRKDLIRRQEGLIVDLRREAEQVISSARNIDISSWSPTRLHKELTRLADAYAVLEQEGVLDEPL